MGLGDEIMATGQAQRAYESQPDDVTPMKKVRIRDAAGNKRWHELWEGNPAIAGPTDFGETLNVINGPNARPYIKYPFDKDTGWRYSGWKANDHPGRIYLSDEEKEFAEMVAAGGAYVLIEPNIKAETSQNRRWPWGYFVEVVRMNPDIRFIQPTYGKMRTLPGVERVDSTFRQACAVTRIAQAFIGTEGALAHASAAFHTKAVVIFGGCINAEYLGYEMHENIVSSEPGTPCGRFWPCEHCQKAMREITPEHVNERLVAVLEKE